MSLMDTAPPPDVSVRRDPDPAAPSPVASGHRRPRWIYPVPDDIGRGPAERTVSLGDTPGSSTRRPHRCDRSRRDGRKPNGFYYRHSRVSNPLPPSHRPTPDANSPQRQPTQLKAATTKTSTPTPRSRQPPRTTAPRHWRSCRVILGPLVPRHSLQKARHCVHQRGQILRRDAEVRCADIVPDRTVIGLLRDRCGFRFNRLYPLHGGVELHQGCHLPFQFRHALVQFGETILFVFRVSVIAFVFDTHLPAPFHPNRRGSGSLGCATFSSNANTRFRRFNTRSSKPSIRWRSSRTSSAFAIGGCFRSSEGCARPVPSCMIFTSSPPRILASTPRNTPQRRCAPASLRTPYASRADSQTRAQRSRSWATANDSNIDRPAYSVAGICAPSGWPYINRFSARFCDSARICAVTSRITSASACMWITVLPSSDSAVQRTSGSFVAYSAGSVFGSSSLLIPVNAPMPPRHPPPSPSGALTSPESIPSPSPGDPTLSRTDRGCHGIAPAPPQ